MVDSLRALLTGCIDYAGQYPPARLKVDEAVNNFMQYQLDPANWMLAPTSMVWARFSTTCCVAKRRSISTTYARHCWPT